MMMDKRHLHLHQQDRLPGGMVDNLDVLKLAPTGVTMANRRRRNDDRQSDK